MLRIARIASILAFVMAGLSILSALTQAIVWMPYPLIFAMAGIGIIRRRAWSAYGVALLCSAQLLLVPFLVFRSGSSLAMRPDFWVAVGLMVVLIPIFFFAGRSLAAAGSPQGRAWPWIALTVLLTAPLFFVQGFVNPTGSMEDTLLIGDHFLILRFPPPHPQHGELIAFQYPLDRSQTFVKRIIGVPGDHIRILDKVVYRNGATIDEPYVRHKMPYHDDYRDNLPSKIPNPFAAGANTLQKFLVDGELIVPPGNYFVLGDNRDNSLDSRYWGFVGDGDLIGKPLLIYDSKDQPAGNGGKKVFEGWPRTRWNRLFKLL
jgi:signal peptidase I